MKKLFLSIVLCCSLFLPTISQAASSVKKIAKPLKPAVIQPKIVKVDFSVTAKSTGAYTDGLVWPKEADTLIEVPSDATIVVSANSQIPKNSKLRWAFVPVWSDAEPSIKTLLPTAAGIANKQLSKTKFSTNTKSPKYTITDKNIGKYLTVYCFVTNSDSITAAPKFPHLIDYTSAVTFSVVDQAIYNIEEIEDEEDLPVAEEVKKTVVNTKPESKPTEPAKPTPPPVVKQEESVKPIPPPQIGIFSAYKMVNSPYGAASKSSSQTVARFEIKTTIASYLKSIKISVEGNLPKEKSRAVHVYATSTLTEKNKLASATLGDVAADGTITLTFKEPQAVYVSEPLIVTLVADTSSANALSWTQFNIYGGLTGVDKMEKFQEFSTTGGLISFGGAPGQATDVVTPPPVIVEPIVPPAPIVPESTEVTASLAPNSPSGANSKSTSQVLAKFILKAPKNSDASIDGVTIITKTDNLTFSENRQYLYVYKTESLTSANNIGMTSMQSTLAATTDPVNGYIKFSKPLIIPNDTSTTLTIVGDTSNAISSSVLNVELYDIKRIDNAGVETIDKVNVVGKKILY